MASSYTLKNIPPELLEFIKSEQKILKRKKGVRLFGFDLVVYHLLRELKACRKGEKITIE